MTLPIDTSRPFRSRADQMRLVEAIRDAPASEQESEWLEWKSTLDLADHAAVAKIVKAIIGFANRSPERAARDAQGTAYMVVGVEPGAVAGVDVVDATELEQRIGKYVGPLVTWRPDYVEVDESDVLIVTVEAPREGDPIHVARKTLSLDEVLIEDGRAYVRRGASSAPARSAEMDRLQDRAQRGARDARELQLGIEIEVDGHLRPLDISDEDLHRLVRQERAEMQAQLVALTGGVREAAQRTARSQALTGASRVPNLRGAAEFEARIAEYLRQYERALPEVLLARAFAARFGEVAVVVTNATDHALTDLLVELRVMGGLACPEEPDADERRLPARPLAPAAEISRLASMVALNPPDRIRPISLPWLRKPTEADVAVVDEHDGVLVKIAIDAVRPGATVRQGVLLTKRGAGLVSYGWEATATNASKRISGGGSLAFDGEPVTANELLALEPPDDED